MFSVSYVKYVFSVSCVIYVQCVMCHMPNTEIRAVTAILESESGTKIFCIALSFNHFLVSLDDILLWI